MAFVLWSGDSDMGSLNEAIVRVSMYFPNKSLVEFNMNCHHQQQDIVNSVSNETNSRKKTYLFRPTQNKTRKLRYGTYVKNRINEMK